MNVDKRVLTNLLMHSFLIYVATATMFLLGTGRIHDEWYIMGITIPPPMEPVTTWPIWILAVYALVHGLLGLAFWFRRTAD